MTNRRWPLVAAGAAAAAIAGTILAGGILDDEAPADGGVRGSMRSAILEEDREFSVYLPSGYDAEGTVRYPVLYVLDGASQAGHTAASASLLASTGAIPPMIVVGIPSVNSGTRNRDYTPPGIRLDTDAPAGSTGAADRFLSFLQTELTARIERDYRTARPRMLAGWSRGGLFAVYSAMAVPAFFDARFAHSPALWRDDDAIVRRLQESLTAGAPASGLLYLSIGDRENEKMTASFKHAVAVLERQAPAALRWRADVSAGGQHESNPRLATPAGLCAMFAVDRRCQAGGITETSGRPAAGR